MAADVTPDASPPRQRAATRRTLLLGVALVIVVLGGLAAAAALQRPTGPGAGGAIPVVGPSTGPGGAGVPLGQRPPPDERFQLPGTTLAGFGDGDEVDLTAFRGRPLVVNFWATWCAPCVKEMPAFQEVASQVGRRVAFLGVNVQDSPLNAEPFARDLGITYDLATDERGAFFTEVRGYGMPTTLFVRGDGTVVYRRTGPLEADELRELLDSELGVRVRAAS